MTISGLVICIILVGFGYVLGRVAGPFGQFDVDEDDEEQYRN
jgi:hypothetical protein